MAEPITDLVTAESGRIIQEVITRDIFPTSPWMTLIRRAEFPQGMGQDLSVLTYERSAPVTNPTWTQIAVVDGAEGGGCLPATTKIPVGSTKRTFYLYRTAVEGPDFCAVDLHRALMLGQQLNAIADMLGDYVRLMWEMHDRQEYFSSTYTKVLVDGCPPSELRGAEGHTWTEVAAHTGSDCTGFSVLTQGILNRYRPMLIRDGAAKSALGMKDGSPILTLISSLETSDNIIFLNDAIRQDIRWGAPNKLLAPLGVVGDYRGFYHVHDPFPRRYSCAVNGTAVLTEILPFVMSTATKGTKAEVADVWRTATLEESCIFDPDVMTQLIPKPVTNPAQKFTFDPVSYVGDIKVMNIPHRENNPDGTILYHRAILAAATMPYRPQRGVAFLHLRCDPACNLVTACTT